MEVQFCEFCKQKKAIPLTDFLLCPTCHGIQEICRKWLEARGGSDKFPRMLEKRLETLQVRYA